MGSAAQRGDLRLRLRERRFHVLVVGIVREQPPAAFRRPLQAGDGRSVVVSVDDALLQQDAAARLWRTSASISGSILSTRMFRPHDLHV